FVCLIFFFFFQAEDGIRDLIVTGVQTCALPISRRASFAARELGRRADRAREIPPRQAQLRLGRQRHYRPSGGRTVQVAVGRGHPDRKSTRLNSSHDQISYAVFCLKKKKKKQK